MRYIDKFVWKPIDWNPASADQPTPLTIEIGHNRRWEIRGGLKGGGHCGS